MEVSVCIPVYKENKYLPRTLQELTKQVLKYQFEIILAEYDPDLTGYCQKVSKDFSKIYKIPIKVIPVERPGIAYARHSSIMSSRAPVFCNFDADARFTHRTSLAMMTEPILKGQAVLTTCNNEFDLTKLTSIEMEDMRAPVMVIDALNKLQYAQPMLSILEPGSCISKPAYVEAGGYSDVPRWELMDISPRIYWKYPGMVHNIQGVSVIVSPRRVQKLNQIGLLETLNYSLAMR